MASPFDNLSDDQILALIREAEGGEKPPETPKFSVNIGGQVIEAGSQEELNRAVEAKLTEALRARSVEQPRPQTAPSAVNFPPAWDMKTFVEKFSEDPDAGLEYMEVAKYGLPVRKAVPQMLQLIAALGAKVQELETNSFAPKEAAEREAVNEIMKSRGWQPSRQSYEDALALAKATGRIKPPEEKPLPPRNERGQFIPPRIPQTTGAQDEEQAPEDIIRAAQNMPLDKLHELLLNAGHFKTGR